MTEYELQCDVVKLLRLKNIYCFSVPNGFYGGKDKVKTAKRVNRLKKEGLRPGTADLVVLLYVGKTIFLELKVGYNKQQPTQIEFQKDVEALGFEYHLVKSLDDVIKLFGL